MPPPPQAPPSPVRQLLLLPWPNSPAFVAPPSPARVGNDNHRHTGHAAGADEGAGCEAAVVITTEETAEVPPEGPLGTGVHDLGDAGQAGQSDGGGGGGAASPSEGSAEGGGGEAAPPPMEPDAYAAGMEVAAAEDDEEAELLEDAAKAATDIAIVLRR